MASADVLPVSILQVAGPHKIAVRVDDDSGRVKEKFYHLQRKLQCLAYEERLRPLQPLEGLCIAKRGASYYRGQVLSSLAAEQVGQQQTNKPELKLLFQNVRVRLVDTGAEELFQPKDVFELPEDLREETAFSFYVCLAVGRGNVILDVQGASEVMRDSMEKIPKVFILKRGNVMASHEHWAIPVEVNCLGSYIFCLILKFISDFLD